MKTPQNPKMLLAKIWTCECDMSFLFFPHDLGGLPQKNLFGLVEVSMQLKFFPCVSLPFWHTVSPDIRCFSCFLGGFGGGFFGEKKGPKVKRERNGYFYIVWLLDFLNHNVGLVLEFQIDEST